MNAGSTPPADLSQGRGPATGRDRSNADRYRWASAIYDIATAGWSGGAIWQTRRWCLGGLRAGESVFVPGPGTGRLTSLAARSGGRVTAVDLSPRMIARSRRRLVREGASVELLLGDWESSTEGRTFDLVVAEHFLNVFGPGPMPGVREALIRRVAPGGRLAIADFRPVELSAPAPIRGLQRLHHVLPLGGCALLTRNAMHPIYDHGVELAGHPDVRERLRRDARSFRIGPAWFRTWIFEKITAS